MLNAVRATRDKIAGMQWIAGGHRPLTRHVANSLGTRPTARRPLEDVLAHGVDKTGGIEIQQELGIGCVEHIRDELLQRDLLRSLAIGLLLFGFA